MIIVKKGRKLNPNRMRHYLVKSTPDTQILYFDLLRDLENGDPIQDAVHKYGQAMYLKYGPHQEFSTHLDMEIDYNRYKLVLNLK